MELNFLIICSEIVLVSIQKISWTLNSISQVQAASEEMFAFSFRIFVFSEVFLVL
jgi:hypothetical protein